MNENQIIANIAAAADTAIQDINPNYSIIIVIVDESNKSVVSVASSIKPGPDVNGILEHESLYRFGVGCGFG